MKKILNTKIFILVCIVAVALFFSTSRHFKINFFSGANASVLNLAAINAGEWDILNTVAFQGKQDDIFFINPDIGWYGNGQGFIYKTMDGGKSWQEKLHKPGTFVRALGFIDAQVGFAGNIGPDYFPGVTDTQPLYKTEDGGLTWNPVVDVTGAQLKGICAIDILKSEFINSGVLDTRYTIRAAGRVGGPAMMATSRDGGKTWKTEDLGSVAAMILDVKFVDERTGFLCAASHSDVAQSHARILKTTDGGETWKTVYESTRPYELIWKCTFPTSRTGYATVQSYNPDTSFDQRYVAKTEDGGDTWTEVPVVKDHKVREFGVGFIDESIGWVGAMDGGYLTTDGGKTWAKQSLGKAVNKIRIIETAEGYVVYAIGMDIRKLDLR